MRGAFPAVLSVFSVIVAVISAIFAAQASRDSYVSDRRSELIAILADLDTRSRDGLIDESAEVPIAQAVWLVGTIHDNVPAAVYNQIAGIIVREIPTYNDKALPLLDEAIRIAGLEDDEYEQVASMRLLAQIHEHEGDLTAMRADFARAVELSDSYHGSNPERLHAVPAFTHVFWGEAEARAGDCAAAQREKQVAREDASFYTAQTASNLYGAIDALTASVTACFAR